MNPKAFISYSWDDETHKLWIGSLAARLRADGIDVTFDKWAAIPGAQLPSFMESAIRESQFIVIICTPHYKARSDSRKGGVGYEGDIMTAEVMTRKNDRKFIPVLRNGIWLQAAPSWLSGKYYIDLSANPYNERNYADLARTLLGIRETAPPVGKPLSTVSDSIASSPETTIDSPFAGFENIKITRVIVEDITEPRNDGTRGSALYSIPFALSHLPPEEWEELFIANWNQPPRSTQMHRPGIAEISGSTVTLNGTTIEEVEKYHRDTLQLVVSETNRQYRELMQQQNCRIKHEEALRDAHNVLIKDVSKRIKFD